MPGGKRLSRGEDAEAPASKRRATGSRSAGKKSSEADPGMPVNSTNSEVDNTEKEAVLIDLLEDEDTNRTAQAIMKPLPKNSPSGGFPRFDDGEVFVIISADRNYQYRFDKATLIRVSGWFAYILEKKPPKEASKSLKIARTNAEARFELRYTIDRVSWGLFRTCFTFRKDHGLMMKAAPAQPLPTASESSNNMPNKITTLESEFPTPHSFGNAEFTPETPITSPLDNSASQMTAINNTKDQDYVLDDKTTGVSSAPHVGLVAKERRSQSAPAMLADQSNMIVGSIYIKQEKEDTNPTSFGSLQYDGAVNEETAFITPVEKLAVDARSEIPPAETTFTEMAAETILAEETDQHPASDISVHIKHENDNQEDERVLIKQENDGEEYSPAYVNSDLEYDRPKRVRVRFEKVKKNAEPLYLDQEDDESNENIQIKQEIDDQGDDVVTIDPGKVTLQFEKSPGGPIIEISDDEKGKAASNPTSASKELSAVQPKLLNRRFMLEIDEYAGPSLPSSNAGETSASAELGSSNQKGIIVLPAPSRAIRPPIELCEAYNNLFLMFYNMRPKISTSSLSIALKQCEEVISIAKRITSLEVIRPYLSNALIHFGKQMYIAIAEEPVRWLKVSISLEFTGAFQEAMIHVVGTTTICPNGDIQLYVDFPEWVSHMIYRKFRQLRDWILEVNQHLFISSIIIDGDQVIAFSGVDKSILSTWLVIQIWRDWFCRQVSESRYDAAKTGKLYRTLGQGGDSYLPADEIKAVLDRMGVPLTIDIDDVQVDLNLLKGYAQKLVRELCVNQSLANVQDAGIVHLTCTTMNDELPLWSQDL